MKAATSLSDISTKVFRQAAAPWKSILNVLDDVENSDSYAVCYTYNLYNGS